MSHTFLKTNYADHGICLGVPYSDGSGYTTPQVVEYNLARRMFYNWRVAVYRNSDSQMQVLINPTDQEEASGWFNGSEEVEGRIIEYVAIDCGSFFDMDDGTCLRMSHPMEELIEWSCILNVFKAKFCPDIELAPSAGFIGAKRNARDYKVRLIEAISSADFEGKDEMISNEPFPTTTFDHQLDQNDRDKIITKINEILKDGVKVGCDSTIVGNTRQIWKALGIDQHQENRVVNLLKRVIDNI